MIILKNFIDILKKLFKIKDDNKIIQKEEQKEQIKPLVVDSPKRIKSKHSYHYVEKKHKQKKKK